MHRLVSAVLPLALLPLALLGCNTEPQTSYCEAVCEWTTQCEADARPIDNTIHGDCRAATMAVNERCEVQETEGVNAAAGEALTKCTDALYAASEAGECSGITGSYDELVQGAPPEECASQEAAVETFTTARYSTWETNPELCGRFTDDWCLRTTDCLQAELGDIPDEVWTRLGGTDGQSVCLATSGVQGFLGECIDGELYEREADLTEPNTARQGARECLGDLAELSCDEVLGGDPPELCAASFTTTEQATGFASAIFDLAEAVREEMDSGG